MRTIPVSELTPNMISVYDIVTAHGQIIASRGAVIDNALISKIRFYGILDVTVADDPSELSAPPVFAPDPPADAIAASAPIIEENDAAHYKERTKASPEFQMFMEIYNEILTIVEKAFDDIKNGVASNLDFNGMLFFLNNLFQNKTTLDIFNTIQALDSTDNICASNINVALISRGIGRWLKFPKESLDKVTLAGLFHDVGKVMVPSEILKKTDRLSDEEFNAMKMHATYGRDLLSRVPNIDPVIINAAYQHHERYDGTGYPQRLTGDSIDPYAAIVAIADVYEAMTALRSHRKPLSPFQVIETFENEGYQKYNPKFILAFLRHIASPYQNRMVMLSDGRRARILYIHQNKLSRPIVELDDKSTIDLLRTPGLQITEVI